MKREPLMEITPDQNENKFFFSAYFEVKAWEATGIDPSVKERCLFMADKMAKRLKVEDYTPDWNTKSIFIPEIMAVGVHYSNVVQYSDDWWFAGFRLVLEDEPYWQACLCLKDQFVDVNPDDDSFWTFTAPRKNLYKATQVVLNAWLNAEQLYEQSVQAYKTENKISSLPAKIDIEFNDLKQLIRIYPKKKDQPVVVAYKTGTLPVIIDLPVYWAIMNNSATKAELRTTFDWPL
ncbi:hypothetical protein [Yersinia ruckeri]|uniref:hypothetical protein n=1 Tax=Yersinia ruckeri TaxID=29486 RepID=UPI002236F62A|nr:hypothetical protein [Yersinia ruckeri]MCW6598637.1 hypothetical protein [Yersinia ruckeri]